MASPTPGLTPSPGLSPAAAASPMEWLSPMPTLSPFPAGIGLSGGPDLPIWPYLIQLAVVTAVVAGLGYVSVRFLRDKVPGIGLPLLGGGRTVKVVDRVALDALRTAFVVNVGKRYWLLAATEAQVTTIAELDPADVESPPGPDFAQLVEKERQPREGP